MTSNWAAPVIPPPPQPSGWTTASIIASIAAGLLLIGSFLAWVSVRTVFGTLSVNGFDGDGKITAAAGALAGGFMIAGSSGRNRSMLVVGALSAAAGAATAVYDLVHITNAISGIDTAFADASAGVGVYVCALGGIVAFIGGMIAQSDMAHRVPS